MCPKLLNLVTVKKDNNNKHLTFNTNFNIRCSVQMTWSRHPSLVDSNSSICPKLANANKCKGQMIFVYLRFLRPWRKIPMSIPNLQLMTIHLQWSVLYWPSLYDPSNWLKPYTWKIKGSVNQTKSLKARSECIFRRDGYKIG